MADVKVGIVHLFGKWYWWDKSGGELSLRRAPWLDGKGLER